MARKKRIFREWQHPRDGRGRFAKRGGAAWAKRAGAAFTADLPESGTATRAGDRPRISRAAKGAALFQAHADGGRPSAVRVPQATITQRPSPAGLAAFNAQRLPTPIKRAAPQPVGLAGFNAPDAPKKRTPRAAPGAAALIAARREEQAPQMPAMIAARTSPQEAPVPGAESYAAMRRHTLLALARDAGVSIRGKTNTQIANELAARDEKVKADRAAKLNPSGVGTPEVTPEVAKLQARVEALTDRRDAARERRKNSGARTQSAAEMKAETALDEARQKLRAAMRDDHAVIMRQNFDRTAQAGDTPRPEELARLNEGTLQNMARHAPGSPLSNAAQAELDRRNPPAKAEMPEVGGAGQAPKMQRIEPGKVAVPETGPVISDAEDAQLRSLVGNMPGPLQNVGSQWAEAVRNGDVGEARRLAYDLNERLRKRDKDGTADIRTLVTAATEVSAGRGNARSVAVGLRRRGGEFATVTPTEVMQLGFHNRTGGIDTPEMASERLATLRRTGQIMPPGRRDGEDGVEDNPDFEVARQALAPKVDPDSREGKLAAKRAELEAAQARLQRAGEYTPGGSSRRKSFGVRYDANLRRAGEAGRDIERLKREIAALERPEAPKAGPVNLDDIKPGGIIKRNGSLYRVLKVNAKSVVVEMPPGWDNRFPKDHKITEVHPPKAEAPGGADRVDTPRGNGQAGGMDTTTPKPRMKRAHATALRQIDAKGDEGLHPGSLTLADTRALRDAGYIEERDINAPGRPKRLFLTEAGTAALRDDDPEAHAKREAAKVKAAERVAAESERRQQQAAASEARGKALEEQALKEGLDPLTARLGGIQAARDKKAKDDADAAVAAQAAVDRGAPSYTAGQGGSIGENWDTTTTAVNKLTKAMLKDGFTIEEARAAAAEQARAYATAMGRVDSARWDRDRSDERREYFKNLRDLTGDPAYDERVKESNRDHFEKQKALRERVAEANAAREALEAAVVGAYAGKGKRKAATTLKLPRPVDTYGKAGPSLADRVNAAFTTDRFGAEVRAARAAALDRIRQEDHLTNLKRERERHETNAGSIMRYEGGDQGNREARQRAADERAKAGRILAQETAAKAELARLKETERRAVASIPKKTGHEYADVVEAVRAAGANGGSDGIRDDPAKERAYRNDIRRRLGLPLVTDDEPQLKSEAFDVPRDGIRPGDYVGGGAGSSFGFQVAAIEPQEDGSIRLTGVGLNGVQSRTLKPGEGSVSVWRPGVSDQNRQPLRDEESDLPTLARRMLQGFTDERERLAAANRVRASKGLPEKGMEPGRVYPGTIDRDAKVAALKTLPRKRAGSTVDTSRVKPQTGGASETPTTEAKMTTAPGRVKPSEIKPGMMISANVYGFPRDGSPAEVARVEPGTRGGARIWLKGKEGDEDVIGLSANTRVDLKGGGTPAAAVDRPRTGTYTGDISADRTTRINDKALTDHAQTLLISVDTLEQAAALGFGESTAPVQVGDEVMIETNRKLRRGIVTGTSRGGANGGRTRVMYSTPGGAHYFTETTQPTQAVLRLVDPSLRPREDRSVLLPKPVAAPTATRRGRTEEQKQADAAAQRQRDAEYRVEENRRYIQEAEEWAADSYNVGGDRDPYSRITTNEGALVRMATTLGVPVPRLKADRRDLRRTIADAIIARVKEQDARIDAATSAGEVRDILDEMGTGRLWGVLRKLGIKDPDYKSKAPELRRLIVEALDGRGKA